MGSLHIVGDPESMKYCTISFIYVDPFIAFMGR